MTVDFEKTVFEYCRTYGLFPSGGGVLLAVSGGADSVALLHALKNLKDNGYVDCRFYVAHINHNLRGSHSDHDEQFVSRLAQELGLAFESRSVDVSGYARLHQLSIETAARLIRMDNLIDIAKGFKCDLIATAHHADDNSETIIHRLVRGTGLRGLCGIEPIKRLGSQGRSAMFVRPLLGVSRDEILYYCSDKNIFWRQDHTNDQLCYTRNRIRHLLLPYLQSEGKGGLSAKLNRLSQVCGLLYSRLSAISSACNGLA